MSRAQSIVGVSPGREQHDFYPTPPLATLLLLEREQFLGSIWEPACGGGAISEVLRHELPQQRILSSDLHDYGYGRTGVDFLSPRAGRVDSVVTNPPFRQAEEFVYRALEVSRHRVALLLKTVFLESSGRYPLFRDTPLRAIYTFSGRLTLYRGGKPFGKGGMISYSWFLWEHGYQGEPVHRWLLLDASVKAAVWHRILSWGEEYAPLLDLCERPS